MPWPAAAASSELIASLSVFALGAYLLPVFSLAIYVPVGLVVDSSFLMFSKWSGVGYPSVLTAMPGIMP